MKTTLLKFLKFINTHKQHFSVSEYSHEDAVDTFLKDHTPQPQEGQTVALYKAVDLKTGEPVQYVGVHPLKWHDHPEQPDMGFVEYESPTPDEKGGEG